MAMRVLKIQPPSVDDERLGGLSEAERYEVYRSAGYSPAVINDIELLVAGSGLRTVGKGALNNIRVHFASRKNRRTRILESHTCERVFAYELEHDPDVRCYYVQIHLHRIVRTLEGGRKHISHATIDFLVFRHDRVELVECKTEGWLLKHAGDGDWAREGGEWTSLPYKQWANERGIEFKVWTPPTPVAPYLRTQEAMYATTQIPLTPEELRVAQRSLALLAKRPYSIDELGQTLPGFSDGIALKLLAARRCFGLITSTPIQLSQHFYLYGGEEQALVADARARQRLLEATNQPLELDAVSTATTTDYAAGMAKLARLERIERGLEPSTVRMRQLAATVRDAKKRGESPLAVCLTNYASSGNRESRLDPTQQQCIEFVIRVWWRSGKTKNPKFLLFELEKECQRHHVETPHKSTLDCYLRREDRAMRALAAGGMRAYQAARPISDPVVRSGEAIAYGHTLHIDSSQFDARCAPEIVTALGGQKPWFYIGIDEATRMPMAYSFYFGKAKTDGFALLVRDFVRRHGFLPFVIVVDRGPDNDSHWLQQFCEVLGITLLYAPTGGSRYNSQAETAIRQINCNVAHQLPGSTEPDMKGRKVDGKFKSKNTARLAFMTVHHAFELYVFDDLPRTPYDGDITPRDRLDVAMAKYGAMGINQAANDDFLIKTSVDIDFTGRATEKRGIKTECAIFTSQELSALLRTAKPDQVRRDCENPSLIYVKIGSRWVKAFKNNILTIASMSPTEQLFELLWGPSARSNRAARKQDVDRDVYLRNQRLAESDEDLMAEEPPDPEEVIDTFEDEDADEGSAPLPSWDDITVLETE